MPGTSVMIPGSYLRSVFEVLERTGAPLLAARAST